jgi:hypothetical protein
MYYASTHVGTPKRKSAVTATTVDGEVYQGCLFVSGDQRIKDLLNGDSEFVAFETLAGEIQILNRSSGARVVPSVERAGRLNDGAATKVA